MNYKFTLGLILFSLFGYSAKAQYQEQFKLVERIQGKDLIEVYEIFNGVKLYVKQDSNAPKVHARMVMKMGYSYENYDKKGLAELLRLLLDNGTANVGTYSFSEEKPIIDHEKQLYMGRNKIRGTKIEEKFSAKYYEIIKRASFYAIPYELPRIMEELNIEQNSYVTKEEIVFDYSLAPSEMKRWFQIQNERITNPAFRQYSTAAQMAKIALFRNNNPATKEQNLLNTWLQPYYVAQSIPDNETNNIDSISSDDVWEYYQKHLYAENISIFIEGNVKGEDMALLAFSYFGHLGKDNGEKNRLMNIELNDIESENEGNNTETNITYKVRYELQGDYLKLLFLKNWLEIELADICKANAQVKVNISDFEEVDLLNIKFTTYQNTDWLDEVNVFINKLKKGKVMISDENLALVKKQTLQQLKNMSYTSNGRFELFDVSFRNKILMEELLSPETKINAVTDSVMQVFAVQVFSGGKFILKYKKTDSPVAKMPVYESYPIHLNMDKISTFGNNILNVITDPYKVKAMPEMERVSFKNEIPFYHIRSDNEFAILSIFLAGNFEGDAEVTGNYSGFINKGTRVEVEKTTDHTIVRFIGNNAEIKDLSKKIPSSIEGIITLSDYKVLMLVIENNETTAEAETWAKQTVLPEIPGEKNTQSQFSANWAGMGTHSKMKTKDLPLFLLLNTYYYDGEYALFYNEINQVHGLGNQYENISVLPADKSEELKNTFYIRTPHTDSVSLIFNEIINRPIDELRLKKAKNIVKKKVLENGLSANSILNERYTDYFKIKDREKLAQAIEKIDAKSLKKYADKYFKATEAIK